MHSYGYAHRDLKPANVMWLPRENQWTLIDFGVAAKLGQDAPISFTMAYAAPEIIKTWQRGATTIQATAAADAWSLGVMVFELLTGRPAFDIFLQGREMVRDPAQYVPSSGEEDLAVIYCRIFNMYSTLHAKCINSGKETA